MDVMKIKSNLMRGIVSKLLSKMVSKKTGYKVNIQLNAIDVEIVDGDAHVHLDVDGTMKSDEFTKVIKSIGLD